MPEIFNDPEFESYRVKEIEEGVQFLKDALYNTKFVNYSPEYFKGAMEMLKHIINLPMRMIPEGNESQKKQAESLRAKAFAIFEAKMMRGFLEEEK